MLCLSVRGLTEKTMTVLVVLLVTVTTVVMMRVVVMMEKKDHVPSSPGTLDQLYYLTFNHCDKILLRQSTSVVESVIFWLVVSEAFPHGHFTLLP